eukprot:scaffold93591_cov49-Attheya_sp.AAC.2
MATTDAITVYFPVKTLTPLSIDTDEPTYEKSMIARDQLNGNAASIPSLRGGGIHGHLALTLTDAEYLQVANNVAFVAPVHPGPLVYTANATGPQQIEQARLYKLNLEEFRKTSRRIPTPRADEDTDTLDPLPKRIRRERGASDWNLAETEGWHMDCLCPVAECRSIKMSKLVNKAKERGVTFCYKLLEDGSGRIDLSADLITPITLNAGSVEVAKLRCSMRSHFITKLARGQPLHLEHKDHIPQLCLDGGIASGSKEYKQLGMALNACDDAV